MKLQLEGSRLRGCWWQIKKILYSCDVWASWFLLLFGVRLHENTCYFWQFFWKTCIQLDLHLSNIPWILRAYSVFMKNEIQESQGYSGWLKFPKIKLCTCFWGWYKKSRISTFKKNRVFLQMQGQSWSNFEVFKCFRIIG